MRNPIPHAEDYGLFLTKNQTANNGEHNPAGLWLEFTKTFQDYIEHINEAEHALEFKQKKNTHSRSFLHSQNQQTTRTAPITIFTKRTSSLLTNSNGTPSSNPSSTLSTPTSTPASPHLTPISLSSPSSPASVRSVQPASPLLNRVERGNSWVQASPSESFAVDIFHADLNTRKRYRCSSDTKVASLIDDLTRWTGAASNKVFGLFKYHEEAKTGGFWLEENKTLSENGVKHQDLIVFRSKPLNMGPFSNNNNNNESNYSGNTNTINTNTSFTTEGLKVDSDEERDSVLSLEEDLISIEAIMAVNNTSLSSPRKPHNPSEESNSLHPPSQKTLARDKSEETWTEEADEEGVNILLTTDKNNCVIVKAATINKLIERLTTEKDHDLMFMKVFILTYQSFMTPQELFARLEERFNCPRRKDTFTGSDDRRPTNMVQLRVCNVFKYWIELCFSDFDEQLSVKLDHFIRDTLDGQGMTALAKKLRNTINKQTTVLQQPKKIFTEDAPTPKVPRSINSADFNFFDVDDEEIARQLTCIEYGIFASIKPTELLNQSWNKPQLQHRSPNIMKLIQRFNNVSMWVASMILKVESVKMRAKVLTKCINITLQLQKLNNFGSMMSFIAGLNNAAIARLTHTKKDLPAKSVEDLAMLERLMSAEGSFKAYRTALHSVNPPLIPYMGLYLQDLTFIEDGNPDFIGHLINYEKRRLICNAIIEIMSYQQCPYNLKSVSKISELLKKLPANTDKELYQLSLLREPRSK